MTPTRPSFLLVVIDTLRADAVSAYGEVEETTPAFDALAAHGTLYANALSPASWTLPSHATLFSGRGIDAHGVGVRGRMGLPEDVITIAERFAEAGYATGGISENLLVSPPFGLGQGFLFYRTDTEFMKETSTGSFDVIEQLDAWSRFAGDAPFFLFVNLFDAHDPYEVRETNPFLPEGVDSLHARSVQTPNALSLAASMGICDGLPGRSDLEILHGLYLGDVHAADAKLGRILERLRSRGHDPVTIVTSDHGEHFGEHGLLGHEFTVRNPALRVPLVVRGAPDLAPGIVDAPVTLADIAASLLTWADLPPDPEAGGVPLPSPGDARDPARARTAMYGDAPKDVPVVGADIDQAIEDRKRAHCRPEHGVFGNLFALLKPPYKLVEFESLPIELYDLRWDPEERSNIASHHPELVESLRGELREFRDRVDQTTAIAPDAEATGLLRALGYLE